MGSPYVKAAKKNHGPCATCGEDILPGQSYRNSLRVARPKETPSFNKYGRRMVTMKYHTDCLHPNHPKNQPKETDDHL